MPTSPKKPKLTDEQKLILQGKATEKPFSGKLLNNTKAGEYRCVVCENLLFDSDAKFDSGSGWPSFYNVANSKSVTLKEDRSHNMQRVEVVCAKCGCHLGHVFNDAPTTPTGMRFCINSATLNFRAND